MITIRDLQRMKTQKKKITMVTCYDSTFAKILDQSPIEVILVGDSAAMVMHGHSSTLPATVPLMVAHTAAVARGSKAKFIVADMPFLSFRKGREFSLEVAEKLMKAGAHAVKLEGAYGHEESIQFLIQSGIPVMGHIGLTPQSIHQLGGFRVQGKDLKKRKSIIEEAKLLEALGCFSIVLECVPTALGKEITGLLTVPTIGIGAGSGTDGQVLVLQDLLGLNPDFKPQFVRHFGNGFQFVSAALGAFAESVKSGAYPTLEESYVDESH
ncbi:MAG: 3-methyl-2-oxobutanoate hydroxymethyltransferase [Bdellovibrionales bacterium]|nr:3-methyl-2-oxobutanoate hydroxymethyltransferase [Bdellovibrionales bacterium]